MKNETNPDRARQSQTNPDKSRQGETNPDKSRQVQIICDIDIDIFNYKRNNDIFFSNQVLNS